MPGDPWLGSGLDAPLDRDLSLGLGDLVPAWVAGDEHSVASFFGFQGRLALFRVNPKHPSSPGSGRTHAYHVPCISQRPLLS